ncbi:hypothetical protein HKD37_02G003650 [Glycine soja]
MKSLMTGYRNMSIWWRDLKRVIHQSHNGKTLHQHIKWKVEAGDKVRFWEDKWINHDQSLAEKYPRLYLNSAHQHQLIGLLGKHSNFGWEWDFNWRRQLFDSEIDLAISFLSEVEGKSIQNFGSDTWVWAADVSGIYSTRSAYSLFWEKVAVENLHDCFEDLWKIKIPSKIGVFAWRMLWDRLPTKSNLRARQVQIPDMTCPFCSRVEENASHIFIHCIKIQPIWWETMSSSLEHKRPFYAVVGIRPRRWQLWWLAVTWSIWQLRNRILFSNATFDGNKLVEDATFLIWTWLHNLEKDFSLHFNQWSSNLRQVCSKAKSKRLNLDLKTQHIPAAHHLSCEVEELVASV